MLALAPAVPPHSPEPSTTPTGLAAVAAVPWGTHLCHFFRSAENLTSALAPYFAAGLANGERCCWMATDPLGPAEARRALAQAVPDLEARVRAGQLEILDVHESYRDGGRLSPDALVARWLEEEERALREGWRGLRLSGNASWLRPEDWADFDAYERKVHAAFGGHRIVTICSYSLDRCSAEQVLDVVRTHGMVLAPRSGGWALVRGATEALATVAGLEAEDSLSSPVRDGAVDPVRLEALAPPRRSSRGEDVSSLVVQLAEKTRALAAEAARRSAVERERDRFKQASRDALTHLSRLQRITAELLAAHSAAELGAVVVNAMAEAMGASGALVAARRPHGGLELVAATGCPAGRRGGLFGLAPGTPIDAALTADRPTVLGSRDAVEASFPGVCDPCVQAFAVLPLDAGGVRRGALAFCFDAPRAFSAADRALFDDLARQAAVALERAQLLSDLDDARVRAEQASRAKDEFLAMLGHELRNPLSPMVTVLHLMERRAPGAFRKERGILERQLRHMEHLVNDLLDVSRIVRGKLALRREPVELAAIVADALEAASPLLQDRRHEVRVEVAAGLGVHADRHRLVQAVVNLLTNAARYTPPGGHVAVRGEARGGRAILSVSDDGQGIDPELAPRVFDLFVQGPRGLARSEGGLGLGLSIVRSVAEMHGGCIRVASEGRGRGSTFTLDLPLAAAPEATAGAESAAPVSAARAQGRRVLIVDDNADAAETLADGLRCFGHEVETAHDPDGALAAAERFAPEIAVVDIGLPGMDGWTLGARLRATAATPPRCIAVTGYGMEADRARSRAAGFDAHLLKPVDLERLVGLVGESREGGELRGA